LHFRSGIEIFRMVNGMPVPEELLEILACPKCKGDLEYVNDERGEAFICHACGLVYLVKDDIPIMLVDEAIPLKDWEERG